MLVRVRAGGAGGLPLKTISNTMIHEASFFISADHFSDFLGLTMVLNLQNILIIMTIVEAINSEFAMDISRLTLDWHNKFRSQELGSNMLQMVEDYFYMRSYKHLYANFHRFELDISS